MRRLLYIAALFLFGTLSVATAQTVGNNCVGFSSNVDGTFAELTDRQKSTLKLKVDQIIARNQVSTTSLYNAFIITPQIVILSDEWINAGVKPLRTLKAEITLTASNTIDNSVYGTITQELKGSGATEEQAFNSLITSIVPTNPQFTKFITKAVNQINDYYSVNISTVLRRTEMLLQQQKYEEAITLLESIPTCVPAYEQSAAAIESLYQVVKDNCALAVVVAKKHIALGDYNKAKNLLMSVATGSQCDAEILELSKIVGDALRSQESAKDAAAIVPQSPTATATPTQPQVQPATTAEAQPTVASASSQDPDLTASLVSSRYNSFDKSLTISVLLKNGSTSKNQYSINRTDDNTFLTTDLGDFYRIHSLEPAGAFTLFSGMTRRVELKFNNVVSSSPVVNGAFAVLDYQRSTYVNIQLSNIPLK